MSQGIVIEDSNGKSNIIKELQKEKSDNIDKNDGEKEKNEW